MQVPRGRLQDVSQSVQSSEIVLNDDRYYQFAVTRKADGEPGQLPRGIGGGELIERIEKEDQRFGFRGETKKGLKATDQSIEVGRRIVIVADPSIVEADLSADTRQQLDDA